MGLEVKADFLEQLATVRLWDGTPVPAGLRELLVREQARVQMVRTQIHQIEVQRKEMLRTSDDPAIEQVRRLLRLKGIGINSAWVDVMEFFAWRAFHNRRELGA